MEGVLNRRTKTVHRRDAERSALTTPCGLTTHVDPHRLRRTSVERATREADADRCERCFEEAGGY